MCRSRSRVPQRQRYRSVHAWHGRRPPGTPLIARAAERGRRISSVARLVCACSVLLWTTGPPVRRGDAMAMRLPAWRARPPAFRCGTAVTPGPPLTCYNTHRTVVNSVRVTATITPRTHLFLPVPACIQTRLHHDVHGEHSAILVACYLLLYADDPNSSTK
jgi:hypothetical protein